jgi:phosphohistidine phosphatase SixA
MPLFLVRHAKAGKRSKWLEDPANNNDDRKRPLDDKGILQAAALADRLTDFAPTLLLSSPFMRCIQTLEPLGVTLAITVTSDERLAEDNPFEPILELLENCPDNAVLCSHGDMIPIVTDALERRGMVVTGMRDSRKASVWVLERQKSIFVRGHAWPPPTID